MVQKRCENVDREEFSHENPCKPLLLSSTYLGGCYGADWKSEGVKRRCEMVQKGVKTLI